MLGEGEIVAHPGNVVARNGLHQQRILAATSGTLKVGEFHDGHLAPAGGMSDGRVTHLNGGLAVADRRRILTAGSGSAYSHD